MDTTLADPLVGRVLDGRYRVEARLARGGMATVYVATDVRLDRTVAVKVMQPPFAADPEFVARFIREAKAAARLSHPNVVAVYDQGTDGPPAEPLVFLVMEYVAGRTLRDLLRERGALPPARALELLEPVLAALGAAHAAGLVHRDVKPENVLLADDGRVKVADFGLVRAVEASTATATVGILIGTVAYLAPEQVATGAADARSDVYAAGIVLFELLTGRPPFEDDRPAATPMSVAFRHVHEDVPPPSRRRPGLPEPVDDLVSIATARDPGTRFDDAYAFLGALRRVRGALPVDDGDTGDGTHPTTVLGTRRAAGTHETLVVGQPGAAEALAATRAAGPPGAAETLAAPRVAGHPGPPPVVRHRATRRRRGRIVALVLALATIAAAVAGWALALGRHVAAPALLSLSKPAAEQRLAAAGLQARWLPPRWSDAVPANLVAYEQPSSGRQVLRGGTVALALSRGPEVHQLPALAGRPLDAAQQALAADRLRSRVGQGWSDTVAAGDVIRTSPGAGAVLHPGDLVTLTVSKGRQPVAVPDVTAKPAAAAKGALGKLGFAVTTTTTYSDTVPKGEVVRQQPASGGTAPHGSAVALVVSRGPHLFPVPAVKGSTVDVASQQLEAAGFVVRVEHPLIFGNVVRGQSPAGGQLARKGSTITLVALP